MAKVDWKLIKVLVVDDDVTFLKIAEKFIKKIGCVGAYVKNGQQAVDMVRMYNFDVCFMDIFMPEMGGVEATCIIREKYDKRLPIIAVTSSAMSTNKDKCMDVGMNDFIIKPLSIEVFKEKLQVYGVRTSK